MATRTTCPYCGVGCGIAAQGTRDNLSVAGDEAHPANAGRLCSKGAALGETVNLSGRLLHPMIGERRVSWARAIKLAARRFREAIDAHGPDAVGFYVSGQLLTEDYYVANKLMKGFIGSGNIDTNSRLCMASAVTAHKLAFGEDVVPACYEDIDLAELVVMVGHNAAWTHPVLFRRMEAAGARGQRHVVIDPRATDTAHGAFLHLKLKSQTDVRLWNGLLAHLWETGAVDRAFIAERTRGLHETLAALARDDQAIAAVAADCDLVADDVRAFYAAFARTEKTVTLFSQGANQSAQGVAKGLAIINAHLVTGRIGKPGASPFSITGQPNAMGGRETGGMANTLAGHMDFHPDDIDRVRRFWNAPKIAARPGLKAVEMFDAVREGRIKALWIMATNPAVSLPDARRVREALAACSFVVVSDVVADTDTSRFAHVRLPAQAWGEKDGTVTNSERCISRQRAFLRSPGAARPDWRIVADLAKAMGYSDAFAYARAADVFREYAALTAFENDGARLLNLGPLARVSEADYDTLQPTRWPIRADGSGTDRLLGAGAFPTRDGKAVLHAIAPTSPARAATQDFPFALNTGRVRDQWHTMTRTGLSSRLMRHAPEPYVEIHPDDARALGIVDGMLARVETVYGSAVLRARVTEAVRPNDLFAPMHWTDDFAPQARANALVNPAVDPLSGQPEFKHTPARVEPAETAWRGFYVTRARKDPPASVWWRRIPLETGQLYEISAPPDVLAPSELAAFLFDEFRTDDLIEAGDARARFLRRAAIVDDRLERVLLVTCAGGLPARDWLAAQLATERLEDSARALILAGGACAPYGKSVCACFDVSREEIIALAVAEIGATVARVGVALHAGTNCGSCRPEIAQILLRVSSEKRHAAA